MSFRVDMGGLIQRAVRLRATAREISTLKQRAIGTLKRRLPVVARRDIQDEYNLPAARLNRDLGTATPQANAVDIIGYARGIGKIQFDGRPASRSQKGATARVRKDGGRKAYPGAFVAVGRSGNRQMFQRTGKARLPIETLYGPSVAQMLSRTDRRERLGVEGQRLLRAELERVFKALR